MIHLYPEKRRRPNSKRLGEILSVLRVYGLNDLLKPLGLPRLPGWRNRLHPDLEGKGRWELIRLALEKLGPSFVKFGQILSTREDLLHPALVNELRRLQDDVQAEDWEDMEAILKSELGEHWARNFQSICQEPIASASIAQVHKGILKNGEEVAIKIQRPHIRRMIEQDIDILRFVSRKADKYVAEFSTVDAPGIVNEFARQIQKELDFSRELQNILRFRQFFRANKDIKIPAVYEELSSARVLVMEFVEGRKLNLLMEEEGIDIDRRRIGRIGAEASLEMILIHGFFHADLHPGNLLVLPGNRLCLLDFGMTGSLTSQEQKQIAEVMLGVVDKDIERVTQGVLLLFAQRGNASPAPQLERDMEELVDEYVDLPIKYIDLGKFIQQVLRLFQQHHLRIPSKFLLLGKAISTIEGVGRRLYPDFNLLSIILPLAPKLLIRQMDPKVIQRKAIQSGLDLADLGQDLPKLSRSILKQMKDGKLRIHFNLEGTEALQRTLELITGRIVFSVLLAAVMISSGIVIHAGTPPLLFGISLVGLLGFGVAGLMGLGMLFHLLRKYFRRK